MRNFIKRLFRRSDESLSAHLRRSFLILATLLLIPAVVSVCMMLHYANSYHSVIQRVERISSLKPLVQTQIGDEMWYVVAGHKTFEGGSQYDMIDRVNSEIDALMETADSNGRTSLNVARRTMRTLETYIDRMGELMANEQPIAESEALLEEVRNVSSLVADMLAEYADYEISSAAETSDRLNATLTVVILVLVLLLLITLIFTTIEQKSLIRSINKPIARMEAFAGAIAGGDLQARSPETNVSELHGLTESLNTMAGKLQDLINENKREQENLKKSELRTLQTQINPHFLYNTLDAIVWLAEANRTSEVIHITRALSDFFRISLSQGKDWIPLSDEIKHLTGYLTIQKIRYRDILDYSIDIPEALYSYQIPKLLLQPLVENAIYHGIKHRRGRGMVEVSGCEEGDQLVLRVRDNGAGMTQERLAQIEQSLHGDGGDMVGYGLFNVNKRVQLYYNQPQGIQIESREAEGTCVSIRVPIRSI